MSAMQEALQKTQSELTALQNARVVSTAPSAVSTAPSAVSTAPSAVSTAPSAVSAAPSAVSGGIDLTSLSSQIARLIEQQSK